MQTRESLPYVGRFAPSPTGPLHLGSLVAAVASYLQARANNGRWLLRIEDIDPPREQAGATDLILHTLESYGFEWDGDVIFQSDAHDAHEAAVALLLKGGHAYPCCCSRRDLADLPQGPLGTIYPGTCRDRTVRGDAAIRIKTGDHATRFIDALQGEISQQLESESGDFIIKRRDGLIAYQLAVVVSDDLDGITEIVRGIDLIDSTPRQIALQHRLGFRTPRYMHIPVITNTRGEKLGKSTGAPGISPDFVADTLVHAFTLLNQGPPEDLARKPRQDIWLWAMENWQPGKISGVKSVVTTTLT
ncbi:MAG TPA: tRNA glutamyl-Q(34) synthetase GluQRS [Woeseiaceae bacterium]|nr:tRNA glutamyl-Q(34) synthetase GluQRS [Woeseiaceae bacterium]